MNYIGSKLTLLPFLEKVVREVAPEVINCEEKTFCDLFAGTGAVGPLSGLRCGYKPSGLAGSTRAQVQRYQEDVQHHAQRRFRIHRGKDRDRAHAHAAAHDMGALDP